MAKADLTGFQLPTSCAEHGAQLDVGEAGEATPHDDVARRF